MLSWLEERIETQSIVDSVTTKYVPPHVNIFYCFGGMVFLSFILQFISGFLLTFFYIPTVLDAFKSINNDTVTNEYKFMRSIHRWTSNLICLLLVLHLSRVYLTGGFKKPREFTWVSGSLLSFSALAFGVSGYSLPWDQIGFWALQIVSAVPEVLNDFFPSLGSNIVYAFRGGYSIGQKTLNRCFSAHTLLLPLIGSVLSLFHFILIRKQGISGPL